LLGAGKDGFDGVALATLAVAHITEGIIRLHCVDAGAVSRIADIHGATIVVIAIDALAQGDDAVAFAVAAARDQKNRSERADARKSK
jgi:imidazole glycerol phosphate synthase subunit HisF